MSSGVDVSHSAAYRIHTTPAICSRRAGTCVPSPWTIPPDFLQGRLVIGHVVQALTISLLGAGPLRRCRESPARTSAESHGDSGLRSVGRFAIISVPVLVLAGGHLWPTRYPRRRGAKNLDGHSEFPTSFSRRGTASPMQGAACGGSLRCGRFSTSGRRHRATRSGSCLGRRAGSGIDDLPVAITCAGSMPQGTNSMVMRSMSAFLGSG